MSFEDYNIRRNEMAEARRLFFEKGIVKREIVPDHVAFAWLRYKYKTIDPGLSPVQVEIPVKKASDEIEKLVQMDWQSHWVGLFDHTGKLLKYYGSDEIQVLIEKTGIHDEYVGNNGIGNSLSSNEVSIVYGYEHYSDFFLKYVTAGIPTEDNQFIGWIFKLDSLSEVLLNRCLSIESDRLIRLLTKKVTNQSNIPDLYFYRTGSAAFAKLCQQINNIRLSGISLYAIKGYSGSGKQTLARFLHNDSVHKDSPFIVINAKETLEEECIEAVKTFSKGTLFIKHLEWSKHNLQREILKKIDCKPINSTPSNSLSSNGYNIVFSLEPSTHQNLLYYKLIPGLQERVNLFQLTIPEFTEIGVEFKPFIKREIMHLSKKRYMHSIAVEEELLNLLTQYPWSENYRDLVGVTDMLVKLTTKKSEKDWQQFYCDLKEICDLRMNQYDLKNVEKIGIERALKHCQYNILKSAESLGITRSTLYKKIKDYGIEVL